MNKTIIKYLLAKIVVDDSMVWRVKVTCGYVDLTNLQR